MPRMPPKEWILGPISHLLGDYWRSKGVHFESRQHLDGQPYENVHALAEAGGEYGLYD